MKAVLSRVSMPLLFLSGLVLSFWAGYGLTTLIAHVVGVAALQQGMELAKWPALMTE